MCLFGGRCRLFSRRNLNSKLYFVLIFYLWLIGAVAFAQSAFPAHAADPAWQRSLGDLGYRQGLVLADDGSDTRVRWSVPASLQDGLAAFALTMRMLAPQGTRGRYALALGDAPLAVGALAAGAPQTLTLPIPAEALAHPVLPFVARFTVEGEASRCEAASVARFLLAPESALVIVPTAPARTLSEQLERLPAALSITLPTESLDLAPYARALGLLALLEQRGHRTTIRTRTGEKPADITLTTGPGPRPEAALVLALDQPLPLAPASPYLTTGDALSWQALAGESGTRSVTRATQWQADLALARLPTGVRPQTLHITLTSPADAPGVRHRVDFLLNGTLVESRTLAHQGISHRLAFALPEGLLDTRNRLAVRFERVGTPACSADTAALPVTLGADGQVALGPAAKVSTQFVDLVPHFAQGVALIVDRDLLDAPQESLPVLADVLGDFVRDPDNAHLVVAGANSPLPPGPFVALMARPPPDVRLPPGIGTPQAAIVTADGETLHRFNEPRQTGLAVLARRDGGDGLWLAPAPGMAEASAIHLARGDIALFDRESVAFWMTSTAPRGLEIRRAGFGEAAAGFARYWPWTASLLWLVLSLGALILLARGRSRP